MIRRKFLKTSAITAAGLLAGRLFALGDAERKRRRPNILFIMSDDHASHAIGAYGSKVNRTPNIDRIAREGVRFDNCCCTNSICAPSRAVILTGKYSHLNGVIDNGKRFDGSQQTLPKLLQQAGYQTAIVGKWHLKTAPTGFHYSNVLPGQGAYHNPVLIENGVQKKHAGYVTDLITDIAIRWLKDRPGDTPFFMMLHHKAPHANWEPDEKHATMYKDVDIPEPLTFNDIYESRTDQIRNHRLHVGPKQWELHFKRFGALPDGMTEQETKEWVYQVYMKNYLRCIASVDDNVGRVLDYLDEAGLRDNTIVIYTSDQGFFLGDHGLYDKRFMYEHALRMPLLMRYPEEIKPGTARDEIVLNLDFAPTLLDYAGVFVPADIQGRSFRAIANGGTLDDWRKTMYYRFYEVAFGIGPHEGVRTRSYKLIHFLYGDEGWELYDFQKDPDEMKNLYGQPKYRELVETLKSEMDVLKRQYGVSS
ncbi:MAG: sulfatase [Sedimentisphaerales bacterium]|nr:sulfatase [Sedimentisphaerales bacterium]